MSTGLIVALNQIDRFENEHIHFRNQVARLAKHWNSTITYDGYISGRSSIFELLGVDAGKNQELLNPRHPSTREAFKRFLETVMAIDTQRIAHFETYSRSDVPSSVWEQTPLLLDPSNPYNNFMTGFPPEARAVFKARAAESLRRLRNVHSYSDFQMLFAPQ